MNNKQKKKTISPIVMFVLSAIFAVMLILDLLVFEIDINEIVMAVFCIISFAVLGFWGINSRIKSLGWAGGAAFTLSASINVAMRITEDSENLPLLIVLLILTIVFIVIFMIKNKKPNDRKEF